MIQGSVLRDAMISASHALSNVKQAVDALNVFPVPDGDTGTNMSMTIANAARELARLQNPTATEVADVASAALLRGARGNYGVILSLFFKGVGKAMKNRKEADSVALAKAFTTGVESAYSAVMKPQEGTILTVMRVSAEKGSEKAPEVKDDPAALLASVDSCFAHLPARTLTAAQAKCVRNGMAFTFSEEGEWRVYSPESEFLAVCRTVDGKLTTVKSFFEV